MQDDELEAFVGRSDAQRAIIVSSMLIEPRLSYNGEGEGKHPYPVDSQSEWMMQCLFAAHRASNVPVGGQATLSRFLHIKQKISHVLPHNSFYYIIIARRYYFGNCVFELDRLFITSCSPPTYNHG